MTIVQEVMDKHVVVPQHDLKGLYDETVLIAERAQKVLPAEAGLARWMGERMLDIQAKVNQAEVYQTTGKPILDQQVLRWRHPTTLRSIPVPKLALINPFRGDQVVFGNGVPHSPSSAVETLFTDAYLDVYRAIRKRNSGRRHSVTLSFTYTGVIPNDVRDLIHEEKPNYEHIFMLADAPKDQWVYSEKMHPRPRVVDPLVLGFTKGQLVLLAQFDPTPLESYISTEFATRQLTTGS